MLRELDTQFGREASTSRYDCTIKEKNQMACLCLSLLDGLFVEQQVCAPKGISVVAIPSDICTMARVRRGKRC